MGKLALCIFLHALSSQVVLFLNIKVFQFILDKISKVLKTIFLFHNVLFCKRLDIYNRQYIIIAFTGDILQKLRFVMKNFQQQRT